MILPDVNVVVFALRPDSEFHAPAFEVVDAAVNGDANYGMAPQVLSSAIRIVTSRKLFARPDSPDTAVRLCEQLLKPTHCVWVSPRERHWSIFSRLCRESDARGNLVADAWFAALAIEWGCEWITFDRDFARFEGLNWRVPGPA